MPYLHWELESEQKKLQTILKEHRDNRFARDEARRTAHQERMKAALEDPNLGGTEKLYWRYLDETHPLHPRRTLDQFYYHMLPDTDERDKDQTVTRYYQAHRDDFETRGLSPVLTMVDQLWMWILPACGKSPPIIITAFPERANRIGQKGSKSTTALVTSIIERFHESMERSVDELARIIPTECSRIYFDTMTNRSQSIQFLEIYATSVGDIVRPRNSLATASGQTADATALTYRMNRRPNVSEHSKTAWRRSEGLRIRDKPRRKERQMQNMWGCHPRRTPRCCMARSRLRRIFVISA
jgi:hypothetical protein